jgi:hypothetical protein
MDVGSEPKARKVVGRAACRLGIAEEVFDVIGLDPTRVAWKVEAAVSLPPSAGAGVVAALRVVRGVAIPIMVSSTDLDEGHWNLEGYAGPSGLREPGLTFVSFSARSFSAPSNG